MNQTLILQDTTAEQDQLSDLLRTVHATPEIICCKENTTSTNDDIHQLYQAGYASALVVSRQQNGGRGQHQRAWISPVGNIYLSALLSLQRPIDGRFSLECGLNLIHCPSLSPLNHLQLKWANDLYSPLGKWGGILIEPINATQIIVGVGINVIPMTNTDQIQQRVTSLTELGLTEFSRPHFLAELYLSLLETVNWFNFDCQNLAERFNSIAAFKDQWMSLNRQHQADAMGYYRGIQNDGAILLQASIDAEPTAYYDGRLVVPD